MSRRRPSQIAMQSAAITGPGGDAVATIKEIAPSAAGMILASVWEYESSGGFPITFRKVEIETSRQDGRNKNQDGTKSNESYGDIFDIAPSELLSLTAGDGMVVRLTVAAMRALVGSW